MSEVIRLLCPECGSDDIVQYGTVGARWGGQAVLLPSGDRAWEDDENGADMTWDAIVVEEYGCRACDWTASEEEGLLLLRKDGWKQVEARLEYLREQIRAEQISWGELAELQGLASEIRPGDVELLEAAGVPEFPEDRYWVLDAATDSNRITEVSLAAGHPVVAVVDEGGGGVIAYADPETARRIVAALGEA